ncbi:hypothetical protein DL93DRAFT_2052137 [Clavulina sp. PMI_390]|nr:hypothetical protein DL93DRAFT_2052137 [Clavulina sp. PMI_390]
MSDAPPEFSKWDAQYSLTSKGDIYSHDPHLNEDGEALYRFILEHLEAPNFKLHCRGTHKEVRLRVSHHHHHDMHAHSGGHEVTITDFDFYIDLTPLLAAQRAEIWTADPSVPAYRGSMYREYSVSAQRTQSPFRSAASAETKRAKQFKEWVTMKGLPPWTPMSAFIAAEGGGAVQATSDQGSRDELKRDVREWADDYCASRKILKDFKFQKVVYGWDLGALKTSPILSPFLPTSTSSPGQDISITFETTASRINIRPDHPLSRALSHTWVVIILWMTLIYPFLWLWRRYDSMGGGRWEICGAAWALKSTPSTGTSTGAQGESEGKYGMKEGEWFRAWEGTIVQAVRAKIQSPQPLMMMSTADGSLSPGATLDGY